VSEHKTPIDQALDLFVYAPVGLALSARDLLPKLVERGRKQVSAQATMARMIGEFAFKQGQHEAGKALGQARTQAEGVLAGLRPPPRPARPTARPAPPASVSAPAAPTGNGQRRTEAAGLAIPGYDSLSASQVVQRLAGLTRDELEAVRSYEEGGRRRKTILTRVAQLQSS
jgi:hypothetical protein